MSGRDRWLVRVLAWTGFATAGEVEEAPDTLGLSGGNEKNVEVYVFFPVSRPSTSPPPPKTQGFVGCPDRPLHRQADLARKECKNRQRMTGDLLLRPIEPCHRKRKNRSPTVLCEKSWNLSICLVGGYSPLKE